MEENHRRADCAVAEHVLLEAGVATGWDVMPGRVRTVGMTGSLLLDTNCTKINCETEFSSLGNSQGFFPVSVQVHLSQPIPALVRNGCLRFDPVSMEAKSGSHTRQ